MVRMIVIRCVLTKVLFVVIVIVFVHTFNIQSKLLMFGIYAFLSTNLNKNMLTHINVKCDHHFEDMIK